MNTRDECIEKIVLISKGNPGVATALIKIAESDAVFLNPLGIAMELTNSKSYAIWTVYKEISNYDISKTKLILEQWFDNSIEPLELWIKNNYGIEQGDIEDWMPLPEAPKDNGGA